MGSIVPSIPGTSACTSGEGIHECREHEMIDKKAVKFHFSGQWRGERESEIGVKKGGHGLHEGLIVNHERY